LSFAEAFADVLLTTDDRLIELAKRGVRVVGEFEIPK
jgi:hypothetical protein